MRVDHGTLPFATIRELNALLAARDISAVEVTKFFSHRLGKYGPTYNALACSTAKRAHEMAKDAEDEWKHERAHNLLTGIPYGAKDLLAVAKYPTTWGAKPFEDQSFDYDAAVIDRLDDRSAPLIGKLSMIELAGGGGYGSASASLQGPCLNPWNKTYWAGGSSSGSAAAVAAGLVPFALGSETSGSIMTPASYCGVTGLRPTYGLVSRYGAMALSWTLDKIGVLAHSADDCGIVLHTIAGKDDRDPGSVHKSFYYEEKYFGQLTDLRIGFAPVDWSDWPAEALRPALSNALAVVKSVGAQMAEVQLPQFPYGDVISAILDSEAASAFEPLIRGSQLEQLADRDQIDGLRASLHYSACDYLKAMRVRTQIQSAMRDLFTRVDLLIAPTKVDVTDRADQPFDTTPPKRPDQKGVFAGLVQAGNLCGLPAISIPCGFAHGLPVGLQIVGPIFTENRILAFAREFQNRSDFHKQHPKV